MDYLFIVIMVIKIYHPSLPYYINTLHHLLLDIVTINSSNHYVIILNHYNNDLFNN